MAMETVTNYKCDRCSRSEIKDGVTILTLTVRPRAGKNVPGLGKPLVSAHVCRENCLKMITAAMSPVGRAGQYDRKAAAERRKAAATTNSGTKSGQPKTSTKRGTKKAQAPASRKIKSTASPSTTDTRAETVRAVRAITRRNGKYAPGYGPAQERQMIAERESINVTK
jgi:hypothetical protein